jgi:hypothetical protein
MSQFPVGFEPLQAFLDDCAAGVRASRAEHERQMHEIRDELGGDEDDDEETGRPIAPASNSRRGK